MRLFKWFTSAAEYPETYYLQESIGLTETFSYDITMLALLTEDIGIHEVIGSIYNEALDEEIELSETLLLKFYQYLAEGLGLSEEEFREGWGYFTEQMDLTLSSSEKITYSISFDEGLALVETGEAYKSGIDYKLTWRSRTRTPEVGYGKTGYGSVTGYGSGASLDLVMFIVEVYDNSGSTPSLLRTLQIPINDMNNPDDDAEYIYYNHMNYIDNGTFQPRILFKVYQKDIYNQISPADDIDIEPVGLT
jgi:hypothetical protein